MASSAENGYNAVCMYLVFHCCVTITTNLAASNNTHCFCRGSHGSEIWAWLSWVLTKLHPDGSWGYDLLRGSTREGFTSNFFQAVGRNHFHVATRFMAPCFFQPAREGKWICSQVLLASHLCPVLMMRSESQVPPTLERRTWAPGGRHRESIINAWTPTEGPMCLLGFWWRSEKILYMK